MDGFTGDLYLDKPQEIERYDRAFERIWEASLNEADSKKMFIEVAREFGS